MKKLLLWLLIIFGVFQVVHATEYYMPPTLEAATRMEKRAKDQWYNLPVVRHFLVKAYYDDKYTPEQKQYTASLIRMVEGLSEAKYRVSPWYEVVQWWTVARLYGQIDGTIDTKTQNLINNNPDLTTIELVYVPGSFHDINNHKAGRMIRAAGLDTKIKKFWFIASGWTDLLMAGSNRIIEEEAQIWVHAWTSDSYPESWSLATNHIAHNKYLNYFTDMWISSNLYWWTIENTRPESIHWLSSSELDGYGF